MEKDRLTRRILKVPLQNTDNLELKKGTRMGLLEPQRMVALAFLIRTQSSVWYDARETRPIVSS